MAARLRKLALTTHVTCSVGWLGSVAAFLALSIAGVASQDAEMVRAAYLSMHVTTWFVIVPCCVAAFLTGLVEGLGTPWGLLRHYWVVVKLLLTLFATLILLLHTQPIDRVAGVAAHTLLGGSDLRRLRLQLVGDAGAALFVLIATTTISIYKPWGLTLYGRRQSESIAGRSPRVEAAPKRLGPFVIAGLIAFVLVIVVLHLFGLHPH